MKLNDYNPKQLQRVKGMKHYGDYDVYYHFVDVQTFSENISSIKREVAEKGLLS